MKIRTRLSALVAPTILLAVHGQAWAIPLPDTSTCSSFGPCFLIGNSSTGAAVAGASTSGVGVFGSASGSTPGVQGQSQSGNGVVGFTQATGTTAAAVSAVPP